MGLFSNNSWYLQDANDNSVSDKLIEVLEKYDIKMKVIVEHDFNKEITNKSIILQKRREKIIIKIPQFIKFDSSRMFWDEWSYFRNPTDFLYDILTVAKDFLSYAAHECMGSMDLEIIPEELKIWKMLLKEKKKLKNFDSGSLFHHFDEEINEYCMRYRKDRIETNKIINDLNTMKLSSEEWDFLYEIRINKLNYKNFGEPLDEFTGGLKFNKKNEEEFDDEEILAVINSVSEVCKKEYYEYVKWSESVKQCSKS